MRVCVCVCVCVCVRKWERQYEKKGKAVAFCYYFWSQVEQRMSGAHIVRMDQAQRCRSIDQSIDRLIQQMVVEGQALCWAAAGSPSSVVQSDFGWEATIKGVGRSVWGGSSAGEVR